MFRGLSRVLLAALRNDTSLAALPPSVAGCCKVYRNFVSESQEHRIWEELQLLMAKDGEVAYGGPARIDDKSVRNISVDLFGFENFHEAREVKSMTTKKIPGLVFSDVLVDVVKNKLPGVMDGLECDSAKVVEHQLPGYEMHVESPTLGSAYAYLSLLSETVMCFDNEAEGGLRWGWRFGERSEMAHSFRGRKIRPEYRFSVQLWKGATGMVDRHRLEEMAESNLSQAAADAPEQSVSGSVLHKAIQRPEELMSEQMEKEKGKGLLGGDYVEKTKTASPSRTQGEAAPRTLQEGTNQYYQTKQDFGRFAQTMQYAEEKQKRGEEISEDWMKQQFGMAEGVGADADGFDVNRPEASWDVIDQKARYYRNKLKSMKYSDDPQFNPKAAKEAETSQSGVGVHDTNEETENKRKKMQENLKGMEHYAKKLGYSQFNVEQTEAALSKMPGSFPDISKLPEFPGTDIEIEVPKTKY